MLSRKRPSTILAYFLVAVILLVVPFRVLRTATSPPIPSSHNSADEPDFWEWDTTTRFSRGKDSQVENDRLCDAFPTEILSQIQVVLKIGSSEPADRINTQISTVTRCITNLLIVSDRESELHGHRVHDILATLPESFRANTSDFEWYDAFRQGQAESPDDNGRLGWNLDRFKFLPMVEQAFGVNPTAKWFVFLESDTYIVWDNLFRMLDHFDPSVPMYMGSPSPGRHTEEDVTTWFAYGGAGFVLSFAAIEKLVSRKIGSHGAYLQPSLSMQYEDLIKNDRCGDSVLGWALYEKGVKLMGMWPMFNPHALHSVPFGGAHWCQPVISMHKTLLPDMEGLTTFENQRNWKVRHSMSHLLQYFHDLLTRNCFLQYPLLYADLFDYLKMGSFEHLRDFDNADWGGWSEPPESPAHTSFEACSTTCHDHPECLSYTYNSSGHCFFIRTVRLGSKKTSVDSEERMTAGWDLEKIQSWRVNNQCEKPRWMKPSITRIF